MINSANYEAPLIEVIEVELERGIALSVGGGTTDPGGGEPWNN